VELLRLDIPYVEISTGVLPGEGLTKSFITPFGIIDITAKNNSNLEILVSGNIDGWTLALGLGEEFEQTILSLIRQIVIKHFYPEIMRCSDMTCSIVSNHEPGTGMLKVVING
jgi:hypothetical protein